MKDAKRRLSLSSEDSEAEEPEYQKEVDDDVPVLDDHSHLLDDCHIKRVSSDDFAANWQQKFCLDEIVAVALASSSMMCFNNLFQQLAAHMPARTQGYPWQLVYSTAVHGSSLKTLYRNMVGLDSPVLLVIKDLHKKVHTFVITDISTRVDSHD